MVPQESALEETIMCLLMGIFHGEGNHSALPS
jgi:hypothetical protein